MDLARSGVSDVPRHTPVSDVPKQDIALSEANHAEIARRTVGPGHVLGLDNGEAAIIRNVGGRVTPATLRTMAMLGKVGQANADKRVPGTWNLVILHHTDCGMTDLAHFPDLLAEYFEIPADELGSKSVSDPTGSVRADVDTILQQLHAGDFLVSGLVYDVETGASRSWLRPPRSL